MVKVLILFGLVVAVFADEAVKPRSKNPIEDAEPVKFPGKSETKYVPRVMVPKHEIGSSSGPVPSYLTMTDAPFVPPEFKEKEYEAKNPHFEKYIQPQFPLPPPEASQRPFPLPPHKGRGPHVPIQPNFPHPPDYEDEFVVPPRPVSRPPHERPFVRPLPPQIPIQPNFPQPPNHEDEYEVPQRPVPRPPHQRPTYLRPLPPQIPIQPNFPQPPSGEIDYEGDRRPVPVPPYEGPSHFIPIPTQKPTNGPIGIHPPVHGGRDYDDIHALSNAVPGVPGRDYPIYSVVPHSGFKCNAQYPGFYADVRTGCQVWHYCQIDGRQDDFLCPNGTLFNQQFFVCDWWYNVNCAASENFYPLNANLYREERKEHERDGHYLPPISAPRHPSQKIEKDESTSQTRIPWN